MLKYAIKMLLGDKSKCIGILLGLTFSAFIITQQSGIFVGLMQRTYGFLQDTNQADIWVMERQVQYIDDIKPFKMTKLMQTRGINGVAWAMPLYKGLLKARLPSGAFQLCNVIGIDDATLIGGPPRMVEGSITNLRFPDGIIVNQIGAQDKLAVTDATGRQRPLGLGDVLELNDTRAKVVGICRTTRTFQSQPVIYTTFARAMEFAPKERNSLSFILVKVAPGQEIQEVAKRIQQVTGLAAYTTSQFRNLTVQYYLTKTGIPINFGVAVFLGFVIGSAICGQSFFSYIHDHLRYFATFKAMGATSNLLRNMVWVQASLVATLGWSLGMGLTALFAFCAADSELSFTLPWWLFAFSGASLYGITLLAAWASVLQVTRLDPSMVFQS